MADSKEDKQKIIDWTFPTNEKSVEFERHFHKWYDMMHYAYMEQRDIQIKKLIQEPIHVVIKVETNLENIQSTGRGDYQTASLILKLIQRARGVKVPSLSFMFEERDGSYTFYARRVKKPSL